MHYSLEMIRYSADTIINDGLIKDRYHQKKPTWPGHGPKPGWSGQGPEPLRVVREDALHPSHDTILLFVHQPLQPPYRGVQTFIDLTQQPRHE